MSEKGNKHVGFVCLRWKGGGNFVLEQSSSREKVRVNYIKPEVGTEGFSVFLCNFKQDLTHNYHIIKMN